MFRKHIIGAVCLWIFILFSCLLLLKTGSTDATAEYQRLMSYSDQGKEEDVKEDERTEQSRYRVAKQVLYQKDQQRLESRLSSDESTIVFEKGHRGEFLEHFENLYCIQQEKIAPKGEESKQYLRTFTSDHAVYSYKSGLLEAENVAVSHYLIGGHQWPQDVQSLDPLMKGKAKKVELSVFKEPALKAEDFQASLFEWGDNPS